METMKKARLEKEAKFLKEEMEKREYKLLKNKTGGEKQMVPPIVENFETFAKKLFACQWICHSIMAWWRTKDFS